MIVMPSNATGWFFHCLARETGKLGHLYSPGGQRGPWPWFPYALDNGAYSCWNKDLNIFDHTKWSAMEKDWLKLLQWSSMAGIKPLWAVVPDVIGDAEATINNWSVYAPLVKKHKIALALGAQDGMTTADVWKLKPLPDVVCVGGTTRWKWDSAAAWINIFPRVHILRCNSPDKLSWLEKIGCESVDGTGWNRGSRMQTKGLEDWARQNPKPILTPLSNYTCRKNDSEQVSLWEQ